MMLAKGESTLVSGRATVDLPRIPTDALVLLSRKAPLGTIGDLRWSVLDRTSLSITSSSAQDTSVVGWAVFA